MTNPAIEAWPDQEDQHVAMTIRRHGCYIHYVAGCACGECDEATSFAYSIGLFGRVGEGANLLPGELLTFPGLAPPHRRRSGAQPRGDRARGQPSLPATSRGFRPAPSADLGRPRRPFSVG